MAEVERGLSRLFDKHPEMKSRPAGHGFAVYKLHIQQIFVIDGFGGGHTVSSDEYYAADLQTTTKN